MENSCPWMQELSQLKELMELQLKLTGELLSVCRHADLSSAFAVDAVNGLYTILAQPK